MTRTCHFILCTLSLLVSSVAFSKPKTIRVAVLENLKLETLSTDKYANDYLDGLKTAIDLARESGFSVELKTFFYDKEPLAILKQVPEVKAWRPDLIIGPRSSSLFLLLKDQFTDTLVLSPFATARDIAAMPDNFYSLTLPNEYFTQAIVNLVAAKFPGKAVAPIGEVDCKNCMNFIDEFSVGAKQTGIPVRPTVAFLNKSAESIAPADLLTHYKPGDVILLPNTSYTSGTLVGRLSDYLKDHNVAFIGGDGWGDWSASYVGKVNSVYKYAAYRATPWSLASSDERTQLFLKMFRKYRKKDATGSVSLLAYSTLAAAITAVKDHPPKSKQILMRLAILEGFQEKRKLDKNYARPMKYAVYKVTQSGETFDSEISSILGSKP